MTIVRDATEADLPAVQRIARAAWHAAYDPIIGSGTVEETVDEWFDPDRVATDDLEPPDRHFAVAERDGEVVGFVETVPDPDRTDTYHLYRIYVAPDRWGEGVGTELLAWAESRLRESGVDDLRLSVMTDNEIAVGFYEDRGFERVGTAYQERFDVLRYEYAKPL